MVDFGLAYRYICDGKHKEYFEDKRRQHDGTIEYTSRDAHRGVSKCIAWFSSLCQSTVSQ